MLRKHILEELKVWCKLTKLGWEVQWKVVNYSVPIRTVMIKSLNILANVKKLIWVFFTDKDFDHFDDTYIFEEEDFDNYESDESAKKDEGGYLWRKIIIAFFLIF